MIIVIMMISVGGLYAQEWTIEDLRQRVKRNDAKIIWISYGCPSAFNFKPGSDIWLTPDLNLLNGFWKGAYGKAIKNPLQTEVVIDEDFAGSVKIFWEKHKIAGEGLVFESDGFLPLPTGVFEKIKVDEALINVNVGKHTLLSIVKLVGDALDCRLIEAKILPLEYRVKTITTEKTAEEFIDSSVGEWRQEVSSSAAIKLRFWDQIK